MGENGAGVLVRAAAAAEFHSQSCCRHSAPHISDSRTAVTGKCSGEGGCGPSCNPKGLQPPHPCVDVLHVLAKAAGKQRERSKSRVFVVVVLFSFSNKKKSS